MGPEPLTGHTRTTDTTDRPGAADPRRARTPLELRVPQHHSMPPEFVGIGQNRPMLKVGSVVLGVADVSRAAAFWRAALGYVPREEMTDDWVVLVPENGVGTQLSLGLSESPVQPRPRVHLDLYARDAADQAAEVERLLALGARRVEWDDYPDDADFVVLADTEGNRFCVIDTGRG